MTTERHQLTKTWQEALALCSHCTVTGTPYLAGEDKVIIPLKDPAGQKFDLVIGAIWTPTAMGNMVSIKTSLQIAVFNSVTG